MNIDLSSTLEKLLFEFLARFHNIRLILFLRHPKKVLRQTVEKISRDLYSGGFTSDHRRESEQWWCSCSPSVCVKAYEGGWLK